MHVQARAAIQLGAVEKGDRIRNILLRLIDL